MCLATGAQVIAVARDAEHRFSKKVAGRIEVVAGKGVFGDTHFGSCIQHLSRVRNDPDQPNLRQVHLIQSELFEQVEEQGFSLAPGGLGENILTKGVNLLDLGQGTILRVGKTAVLKVTGLRNPCQQIDRYKLGLLKEVAWKHDGNIVRKAGIMSIVLVGGTIQAGDQITIEPPSGEHIPLKPV